MNDLIGLQPLRLPDQGHCRVDRSHIIMAAKSFAALLIAVPLACCTPSLPDLPAAQAVEYHLGPGDQIRVITYDEPQLTNLFTIDSDGTIQFPLVGDVKAAGLTPAELASGLSASLQSSKLISQPSVSVQVAQYRPISILGEVNHPGQYPYQPGMTTMDAVALAGGFTYRAVTDHAGDLRSGALGGGQAIEGSVAPAALLQPGDVLTIYERYF